MFTSHMRREFPRETNGGIYAELQLAARQLLGKSPAEMTRKSGGKAGRGRAIRFPIRDLLLRLLPRFPPPPYSSPMASFTDGHIIFAQYS